MIGGGNKVNFGRRLASCTSDCNSSNREGRCLQKGKRGGGKKTYSENHLRQPGKNETWVP